jgi:hypothetical protein
MMMNKAFSSGWIILSLTACAKDTKSHSMLQEPLTSVVTESAIYQQLHWVLALFNEHQGRVSPAEITARFHPIFLKQMTAEQVSGLFLQLYTQLGALKQENLEPLVSPAPGVQTVVAHTSSAKGKIRIVLSIDEPTGQINGFFIQPDSNPPKIPLSLEEADSMLKSLATDPGLLVAEVKDGQCQPVHQLNATQPLAMGSTFKLYILLALADQVRQKKLSWDDRLKLQGKWKSLPSGTMQHEPDGSEFTLQKYAEQMISISDNTATDHLLYTLGREQVEAVMAGTGHSNPDLNRPFLSTKELFFLKFQEPLRETFLSLDAAGRRRYLDNQLKDKSIAVTPDDISSWSTPREIKSLEWFASSADICQTFARFIHKSASDQESSETAMDILAKNPGIPTLKNDFHYVGFKGGSEPGVFSVNWLLQRKDQRWFVVSLTGNDSTKPLKDNELLGVASGVLTLVNAQP